MAGRHSTVNEKMVHDAVLVLMADGKPPTIKNVRAGIGQTGSPNTITRHMHTVYRRIAERVPADNVTSIPASLDVHLQTLWNAAIAQAKAEQEDLELDNQEALSSVSQRAAAAERECSAAQQINADYRARQAELENEKTVLGEQLAELKRTRDELQRANSDHEESLRQHSQQNERLTHDLDLAREQLEQTRTKPSQAVASAKTVDDLKAQLEWQSSRLSELSHDHSVVIEKNRLLKESIQAQREDKNHHSERTAELQEQAGEMQARVDDLNSRAIRAESAADELSCANQQLAQRSSRLETANARLSQEIHEKGDVEQVLLDARAENAALKKHLESAREDAQKIASHGASASNDSVVGPELSEKIKDLQAQLKTAESRATKAESVLDQLRMRARGGGHGRRR